MCASEIDRKVDAAKAKVDSSLTEMATFSPLFSKPEFPFHGDPLNLDIEMTFDDSHTIFSQGLIVIEQKKMLVTSGKAPDTNLNFYLIEPNWLVTSMGYLTMGQNVCNLKYSDEHEYLLGITLANLLYVISLRGRKPVTVKTIEKIAKYNCLVFFSSDPFLSDGISFEVSVTSGVPELQAADTPQIDFRAEEPKKGGHRVRSVHQKQSRPRQSP